MNKNTFLFFGIVFLFSCQEKAKIKKVNFEESIYLVTEYTSINDSTIAEKYKEYFAYIKVNSTIINWKKILFQREVKNLNDKGLYYFQDSIFINYSLNKDYTIRKIENWASLMNKVKSYYNSFTKDLTPLEIQKLQKLDNIIFDSSLIAQKNTQEIELFNQGLHYLQNEKTFKKMGFKIKKESDLISIFKRQSIENEEIENYFTLFSDLTNVGNTIEIKNGYFDVSYVIYPKNNSIISAELEISLINNQFDTIKKVLKMELNGY